MKIAIIGSGISGTSLAWMLCDKYDISLFEKNNYVGGHANTVDIDYDGSKISVDTGFIVYNHRTYPNLKKLFDILQVEIVKSDMSFGINAKLLQYSVRNLRGLFANWGNIFDFNFLRMLFDINKFNKKARKFVENGLDEEVSLGEFLSSLKLGKYFKDYFLLPMAGAIWSCPEQKMLDYPALSFLRFYYNHGLLTILDQPQWYSVKKGSKEYVKKLCAPFKDKIHLNCKVKEVKKEGKKIIVTKNDGTKEIFDKVVFANHGDEIAEICPDLPKKAQELLQNFRFQKNLAVLHKDLLQLPKNKKAWASWIYNKKSSEDRCCVTYYMNWLQGIDEKYPLFVTLNPLDEVKTEDVFAKFEYHHPIFDENAIKAQEKIPEIQGIDGFYYVGAYQANGFHEDGLLSAIKVAKLLGVEKL